MRAKTQWVQQFADPHTGQKRDCIHGNLARSCNICEMEHEIFDLNSQLDEAKKDKERLAGTSIKWILEQVAKSHSCTTGDCPHLLNDDCVKELVVQFDAAMNKGKEME